MATDSRDAAKAQELGAEPRLGKTPDDAEKHGRDGAFRLGQRTYPIWTATMVRVREELRAKGRKWYLLHDKVYDDRNLRAAWKQVEENGGAPGLSGTTIEEYSKAIDKKLTGLAQALSDETYRARPIRRKWIPKTDGSGQQRPLGIPEVEDRVAQAAIVRVIEPIFEGKFFEGSYGFRPERGALNALEQLEREITTGRPYLVDADIRNCFGSIPHDRLMEEIGKEISDPKLLRLIRQFVEADIVEEVTRWTPEEGTPQGAVLSPLLANIFLHEFDRQMLLAGYKVIRYADDFVVTGATQDEAEGARKKAEEVLASMGLQLHPQKTRVVDTRVSRFQFLGYEFWPRDGKPPGRQPRRSSQMKLRDAVRAKTPRRSGKSLREIISDLNPTLRGWFGYFRHCFHNIFAGVDGFVRRRLRTVLRKFKKRHGSARNRSDNARYPNEFFLKWMLFSLVAKHEDLAHQRGLGARALIPFPART